LTKGFRWRPWIFLYWRNTVVLSKNTERIYKDNRTGECDNSFILEGKDHSRQMFVGRQDIQKCGHWSGLYLARSGLYGSMKRTNFGLRYCLIDCPPHILARKRNANGTNIIQTRWPTRNRKSWKKEWNRYLIRSNEIWFIRRQMNLFERRKGENLQIHARRSNSQTIFGKNSTLSWLL
jgi:hypothetical protein